MVRIPHPRVPRSGFGAARFAAALLALAAAGAARAAADPEVVEARTAPVKLAAPGAFTPKDGVVTIEISEYAGYAGLLAANGGLEPNPESIFAKRFGFPVKITVSEAESWSPLNAGRIAAAPSTVDVLAAYGRQLKVKAPVLLGFSRGADGVVTTADIRRVNDLKGKRVATCQFTEADFFLRYLAQEASLPVKALDGPDAAADPEALDLVYTADAFGAGDLFARDLAEKRGRLAGCATWDPKTGEVVEGAKGAARLLASNRNLLIVADVLMVNAGFADAEPDKLAGLVAGILPGNAQVRADPSAAFPVLEKAFGWSAEDSAAELAKVHLANWQENMAFFDGRLGSAASFAYLHDTALEVYGPAVAAGAAEPAAFLAPAALGKANADGAFNAETIAIPALRDPNAKVDVEAGPLLAKNLYFYFDPNTATLTAKYAAENERNLANIAQWLRVAPGSRVRLRGHADGSRLPEIRKNEGAAKERESRVFLKNLSRQRSDALRDEIHRRYVGHRGRVDTQAVGADEPTGKGPDADRRVEAQWFTVE